MGGGGIGKGTVLEFPAQILETLRHREKFPDNK